MSPTDFDPRILDAVSHRPWPMPTAPWVMSAAGSLFARLYSGQTGVDPYTTAVSDTYQDLFGEGIFTGKGLYDVDAFMLFDRLASRVFGSDASCISPTDLATNTLGQSNLWGFGISGDLPVVLVRVTEAVSVALVRQVLHAQEYWRLKGLRADVVILNEHPAEYLDETQDFLIRLVQEPRWAGWNNSPGGMAAGTALDTVYATVGKKPALFRLLIEMAISGSDRAIRGEERDYVRAIRAERDAARKLRLYAAALGRIQPRLAPLIRVLQGAASLDVELEALWQTISQRRADNMRLLAKDLAVTGRLRSGLSESKAADIIWTMNSPEFYQLLVEQRGWSLEEYERWLGDAWIQLLLEPRATRA